MLFVLKINDLTWLKLMYILEIVHSTFYGLLFYFTSQNKEM